MKLEVDWDWEDTSQEVVVHATRNKNYMELSIGAASALKQGNA